MNITKHVDPHNAALSPILNYLTFVADCEPSWGLATFIKKFGRQWHALEKCKTTYYGNAKECFANAQSELYATRHKSELVYVEGFACATDYTVPVHHAWLIDEQGMVRDPTWQDAHSCLYFGVALQTPFVMEAMEANGNGFGAILDYSSRQQRQFLRDETQWNQAIIPNLENGYVPSLI